METSLSSTQKLRDFWYERSSVAGFIVLFLFLNGLLGPVAAYISSALKDIEGFDDPNVMIVLWIAILAIIIIANMVLLLLWLYWRSLPRFQTHEIAILFAPHYNHECGKLVRTIFDRFVYELARRDVKGSLRPVFLMPNQVIANSEEANRVLFKTGARLIVYGCVDQGQKDGQEVKGFKNIAFLLRHRTLNEWEKKAVFEDLASALAFRAFSVKTSNNFIENDIVASNLTEVALFFVALALTLESRLELALGILSDLYKKINGAIKSGKATPQLHVFFRSIRRCYSVALDAKYNEFYASNLLNNVTDKAYDEQFREGEEILKELLMVDSKKSQYPLRQAIFDFHFGNVDEAFKNIAKAKKLAPETDPAPNFSFAFLCLWMGQYKRAIREYRKAAETENHILAVNGPVLEFIQTFHRRYPDRPEFIFALGFMNENFFDLEMGASDYREFLSKTDGKTIYLPLADYARERLGLIEEAGSSGNNSGDTRSDSGIGPEFNRANN